MNATEFKAARQQLRITQAEIGVALGTPEDGFYSVRTVCSWESGDRGIAPAVAKVVRLLLKTRGLSI